MSVTGCTTVTRQLAVTAPAVTLIVVLPTPTALTVPSSLTVATEVFADFHDTASVKSSGVTASARRVLVPLSRRSSVLSSAADSAFISRATNFMPFSLANVSAYVPGTP